MKENCPFRPAELVIPDKSSKDQRWYIKFYAYHVERGKVVRKRFFSIPTAQTPSKRKAIALQICQSINERLKAGEYIGRTLEEKGGKTLIKKVDRFEPSSILVSEVVENITNSKTDLRLRTIQSNMTFARVFRNYLKSHGIDKPIGAWNIKDALEFKRSLELGQRSPRTINNYIIFMRHVWRLAIKQGFFHENPWEDVRLKKETIGKNIAYLPHQQKEIMDRAKRYPNIRFVIQFVYYTLARSNEISNIKIKDITDKIYIHAEHSKNAYERWLVIPPPLENELLKRKIRELNPDWYLFGSQSFNPGPKKMRTSNFGEHYRNKILKPLGYSKLYTLYSWKHTGVIAAHKAGVSDDDIMLQTGHKNYGSFQVYLKSLGLFENESFASKIPEI